jgi:hypothetical protein
MKRIVVHMFRMSDSEDPEIYAAEPIYKWQQTEIGQWVMAHSVPEPDWTMGVDQYGYGHRVHITASLSDEDATYFLLKYNIPVAG